MVKFISVYKLLENIEDNSWTRVDQMASALELGGAAAIDRYGRLNIAPIEQVNKVLDELAYYYRDVPPLDNSFKRTFARSDSDIHYVGWLESNIPNLQHKHQLWQESIGVDQVGASEEIARREPRRQSKFWMLSQAALVLALQKVMPRADISKVNAEMSQIVSENGKSSYTIPLMKSLENMGLEMSETTFRKNLRDIFKTNTLNL